MKTSAAIVVQRLQRAAYMLLVAGMLAACGGGGDTLQESASADSRQTALSAANEDLPQALVVVALEKVNEVRFGRTTFDYTFRVLIRNDGQARGDVHLQILGAGAGTTILDGQATLPVIEAGETKSATDTVTIRHNRVNSFNPAAIQWRIISARAVVISGFVIDDPVANASLTVTSLSSASVIATATTDQKGQYATPSLPQSSVAAGYSIVASGGTVNGQPFIGTLKALYVLPADYAQSHVTLLTTVAAKAAEAKGGKPTSLPATADQIGNEAAARGFFPQNWKSVETATSFGVANSTAVMLSGPDAFTFDLAQQLLLKAPPANGSTECFLGFQAGELVCSARIGPAGGRVFSQTGSMVGEVLADIPPLLYADAAVEVAITLRESANSARFWVSAARDLSTNAQSNTLVLLVSRRLFSKAPAYTLPAVDFIGGLNVEDSCAAPAHSDMPNCVTVQANIRPANFVLDGTYHRVPSAPTYTHQTEWINGGIYRRFGSNLSVARDRSAERFAVLFVHGYTSRIPTESSVGTFGGDDGTWGAFPVLVGQLADPLGRTARLFDRYNFQWRSNASFYSAGEDLAAAIRFAYASSGNKKIHIVAHSFGGLLARVVLQNLTEDKGVGDMVESLTTLGTPHSGIRDPSRLSDPIVEGTNIRLPDGWDAFAPEILCGQLSCYEAGLQAGVPDWVILANSSQARRLVLGKVIAELKETIGDLRPSQKLLALMGVGFIPLRGPRVFDSGDQLITLAGQRLHPEAAPCAADSPFIFSARVAGGAIATERVLGLKPGNCPDRGAPVIAEALTPYAAANGSPGGNDAYYGYAHTGLIGLYGTVAFVEANEANIPEDCGNALNCLHDSWVSTRALLLSLNGGPPSPDFATGPMSVGSVSCSSPVVGSPMTCFVIGTALPVTVSFTATNCTPQSMAALEGNTPSQRSFTCTPDVVGVLVEVSYQVPGFVGPLPGVPALVAAPPLNSALFEATGSMRDARVGHTATLLNDGTVLVTGGDSRGNTAPYLRTAEIYTPRTGRFTPAKGEMVERRGGHTATLLPNGKVLIAGGFSEYVSNRTLSSAEIYDPETGLFEPARSMNVKRAWHAATQLNDGRVLIIGGFDNQIPVFGTYLRSAEIFNPFTGEFHPVGNMALPRIWFASTKLQDGRVLVAGGSDRYAGWTAESEIFDAASEKFRPAEIMGTPRWVTQSVLLNDGSVLIPGGTDSSDRATSVVDLYVRGTESFLNIEPMKVPRGGVSVTLLADGRALLAGGGNSGGALDSAQFFEPETRRFVPITSPMATARYAHTATALNDGTVLIVGGVGKSGRAINSAEKFVSRRP